MSSACIRGRAIGHEVAEENLTMARSSPTRRATEPAAHLPYVALAFIILAWGAGPVITKLVTAPPLVGVLLRFGITFPVLFAIVHLRGGRVPKAVLLRAAPPGIAFGINLIFVFEAVQEATVAVLAVGTTMQPALVLLVAGPMFGERPTRLHVLWTGVAVAGAAAVVLGAGSELQASALGIIWALLAVCTFTVYFVFTRLARSTKAVDPFQWMAAINVWAFATAVPFGFLFLERSDFDTIDAKDWLWLVILAYGTGVFGHTLMSWVHGYVQAARSSVALLAMNIFAVSLAWPVHDEPVTPTQLIGGVVVLGAVTAVLKLPPVPTSQSRKRRARANARQGPDRQA
jgi:drug/metabolite transporter (DMT)-like permease